MTQRIWVVTGTSSGFGLAIAKHALSEGDKVIATVRSLDKFPVALKEAGAHPLVLDLNDTDANIRAAAEAAIKVYGRVDVLVNNAGSTNAVAPLEELEVEGLRRQFQENLYGTIAFTQPFVTHFRVRRSGHIINISSMAAHLNFPSFGAYSASKAALDSMSHALAQEVALYGVKVHIIEPGYFTTNILAKNPLYTLNPASNEAPLAPGLSKIYTELSQGYNLVNRMPGIAAAMGRVGDNDLLARRLYEIATDTGIAKELEVNGSGPRLRIPLGSDSGEALVGGITALLENYKAVEPIWRSTDSKQASNGQSATTHQTPFP
ncbi:NAD-P-binding protein [Irpex lacteus]|nr:NAD-P-binding protein [Irpex lacteus]